MIRLLSDKINLPSVTTSDKAAVYRVRMSNQSGSLINKVPPVIVKFTDKKMARKVYKAKASLAASGIFRRCAT